MAAHLSNGRINLAILRESYRRELLECLDKCTGSKAIVWDEALTGPFGLIAEYSLLKEHEVDKMFPLQEGRLPPSNVHNIIFFVRPQLDLMNMVAQNLLREEETSRTSRKEFHIFFMPRKSLLCEKKLQDLGVYGNFTNIDEYCIDMIPFDSDLLSMEMEGIFKDCFLENDMTGLYHIAKSLMTLQALYGTIPNIYGKGHCAQFVCDMMLRMRRELNGTEPHIASQIDNVLLLDRTVDPLTPLLSQLTYEGLIDDLFGIQNTTVKLPPEKFAMSSGTPDSPQEVSTEPKKIVLNSSEELFAVLRDKNFNAVGPTLSQRAKSITAQFETRHDAKTISEIKEFVSQLPHMQQAKQSLATHTSVAELIKEVTSSDEFMNTLRTQQEFFNGLETDKPHSYIEDCIAKQESIWKVLKLICIQSFCNGGFKQKVLDYYKRELIQTYGFEHVLTLGNLEKIGLLKLQTNRMYSILNKSLRLVVEEVNEQNPDDVAYVFSGYAPLSVRLAQFLHQPGWRSIMEVLNILPGPTVEEIQQIPIGLRKRRGSIGSTHSSTTDQKVTLVVFIGGVTYAEVSALRFLSQMEDAPVEYLVATSKIINSSSWLKSMQMPLKPRPVNPF